MNILEGYHLFLLFSIPIAIYEIYLRWVLVERTGLNPWLSILALIPIVNVVFYWKLAFSRWPSPKQESER